MGPLLALAAMDGLIGHGHDVVENCADEAPIGRHSRRMITSIGVGPKPAAGLERCGQFDRTAITGISAISSTWSPGFDRPASIAIAPSCRTGTFMKKFTFVTI